MIEARLLELAHTTDAKITAPALAYFAPCSLDDASRVLDDLSSRGTLAMTVEDDGTISYEMLGRQKLEPAIVPLRREALVPVETTPPVSPVAAGLLSVLVPGAGHLYAGRVTAALMWFVVVSMGYFLLLPGLVLHMFCIASAVASAHHLNEFAASPRRMLPSGSHAW